MMEFIKYTIAGVVTTLMNYVIYSAGLYFHINYLTANTIAWCFAVLFAYFMNRNIVFQSKNNSRKEMILFVTLRFLTLLVENVCLWIFIDYMHWNAFISKIIVMLMAVIGNYFFCKFSIFK